LKIKLQTQVIFLLLASFFFTSCSDPSPIEAEYAFQTARDVNQDVKDYQKVKFSDSQQLDLGFYEGTVWIKLQISNTDKAQTFVVLCNDLINHNYRFYKFDSINKTFKSINKNLDIEKYDHRSYTFAKPNFKIELKPNEKATYLITTNSDGRILQATPRLLDMDQFQSIKLQMLLFDILFYSSILLLLLVNLFYFRLIRSDIYYYYGAYILSGCLMYLFVEGRLYGLGWSNAVIDHLMFIAIRVWILSSLLFTLKFLETKTTNPKYYRFILILLAITLGFTCIYQLVFHDFSISTLHQFENLIGFVWILLSLLTVGIAFKKRKQLSIYYLISYLVFLFFVTLGLIDSHTTILPGDPFSYFKIGTIFEFIGFTYFITLLIKQKLKNNEKLEDELTENKSKLEEKEKVLASNINLVSVLKMIENSFSNEADWNEFTERFNTLNPNFFSNLLSNHPDLSKSEIRLLALIRIGYSQKEISNILNIAPDSVKKTRTRVRKKLYLDEKDELNAYLLTF
jgi:DNA-binding CsgD family transcriptional regulator/uncharacterized membrane protein YwzB